MYSTKYKAHLLFAKMDSVFGDVCRRATRSVQDHVTQIGERVNQADGEEEEEEGSGESRIRTDKDPRKRIILLTAFLACLSFLVIFANTFMSFIYNVVKEESFWRQVSEIMIAKNVSKG